MKFDPIVFNALKKEQADLAGVMLPDLRIKKHFNSVPADGRIIDMNDYPAIKNKMRWDYPGVVYGFELFVAGTSTIIDRNSIPYYHGMDFNPDDGYVYFVAMSSIYRIHQTRLGLQSHEIVHESTVTGNTTGEFYACKYLGRDLLLASTITKGSNSSTILHLRNLKTNTFTETTVNFLTWFHSFKLGAVLFNNRIFLTQLQVSSDVYPAKTQRLKSCALDLTGFTEHLVGLVGITTYVIGNKLFVAGYETSEVGNFVIYSSLDGTNFTKIGTLPANQHNATSWITTALPPAMAIGNSIIFGMFRTIYEFNTLTNKFNLIYDGSMFMQGDAIYIRLLGNIPSEKKILLSFSSMGTDDLKTYRSTTVFAMDYKLADDDTLMCGKIRKLYRVSGYSHYGVLETSNGIIVKTNVATTAIHITRPKRNKLNDSTRFGNKQLEHRIITGVDGSN